MEIACSHKICLIFSANASEAQKYKIFLTDKVTALLFDFDELFISRKVALYSAQIQLNHKNYSLRHICIEEEKINTRAFDAGTKNEK